MSRDHSDSNAVSRSWTLTPSALRAADKLLSTAIQCRYNADAILYDLVTMCLVHYDIVSCPFHTISTPFVIYELLQLLVIIMMIIEYFCII